MADADLKDPLNREFTLADNTWYGHILKGHPEMRPFRQLVEQAVTSPQSIWISSSDPNCRICYGVGPGPGILVAVVADLARNIVKTAHLAKKITGARQEWPDPLVQLVKESVEGDTK